MNCYSLVFCGNSFQHLGHCSYPLEIANNLRHKSQRFWFGPRWHYAAFTDLDNKISAFLRPFLVCDATCLTIYDGRRICITCSWRWTSYLIVACKERRAEVRPTFGHHKLFRSINNLDSGLYNLNFQIFPYVESIDIWYEFYIILGLCHH